MPSVICQNQHVTHWRNQQGSHQPATCPQCGQPTKKAIYDFEQHRYVTPAGRPKRVPVTCAVCGHRRMAPSPACRKVETDTVMLTEDWLTPKTVSVPAGAWVCWIHRPERVAP